jgi:hypothetical protein
MSIRIVDINGIVDHHSGLKIEILHVKLFCFVISIFFYKGGGGEEYSRALIFTPWDFGGGRVAIFSILFCV